jgi:cell division protein FtsZ
MKDKGLAHMGIGKGRGEYKTMEAVRQAVTSQLLETSIEGATGILFNITGGKDLSLAEIYEAVDLVRDVVDNDCNIIFGATIDESMKGEVQVTVIATGFDVKKSQPARPQTVSPQQNVFDTTIPQNLDNLKMSTDFKGEFEQEDDENIDEFDEVDTFDDSEDEGDYDQTPQVEDISFNSKIDLGDTNLPPFLRKLRK